MREKPNYTLKSILVEYMTETFGRTLGEILFEISEQRFQKQFDILSSQEQFKFIQDMMYHIYRDFYSPKKIRSICMNIFFRYSKIHIEHSVERIMKRPAVFDNFVVEHSVVQSLSEYTLPASSITLCLECKGITSGYFLLFIDERSSYVITRYMLEGNGRQFNASAPPDKSTIVEFVKQSAPDVLNLITEMYGATVNFNFVEEDEWRNKLSNIAEDSVIEVIFSNVVFSVEGAKAKMNVCYMWPSVDDEAIVVAKREVRRKREKLFNLPTPQIVVKYSSNVNEATISFLDFVFGEQGKNLAADVCGILGMSLNEDLSPNMANGFINLLLGKYMTKESEHKKQFVRKNLEVLFFGKLDSGLK